MDALREQLSLYVPSGVSAQLEEVRRALDPLQHSLIPAHVTLLRDDELKGLAEGIIHAALGDVSPITLAFGSPVAFAGHGILLPCIAGVAEFVRVRKRLVGKVLAPRQAPHITLAHPRNVQALGNSLDRAACLQDGIAVTFPAVQHIRQIPGNPWSVVRTHHLMSS